MYKLQFFFTFIFAVLLLFSLAVVSLSSCLQNFWDATLTYTPNNFESKSCFFGMIQRQWWLRPSDGQIM